MGKSLVVHEHARVYRLGHEVHVTDKVGLEERLLEQNYFLVDRCQGFLDVVPKVRVFKQKFESGVRDI